MATQNIEKKLENEQPTPSNVNKSINTSVGDIGYTLVFHKTPNVLNAGTTPINAQIEVYLQFDRKTYFEEVSKVQGSNNYANLEFFYILCRILKDEIKLTKENRRIIRSTKNMEVFVHWLHNKEEDQAFISVAFIATVAARANLRIATHFLKHYRFDAIDYLQCMRAAIRNGNAKLLSTILENQTADFIWENYFPFLVEESVNGEIRSHEVSFSFYFSNVIPNASRLRDDLSQNLNYISDSPLSYALRKGCNSKVIEALLKHGAHSILERYGHRIDVSKELSEYQEGLRNCKSAFLMGFHARLAQDSAIFNQFLQSEIAHPKELTREVFDFL